jgi:hypothetical protein
VPAAPVPGQDAAEQIRLLRGEVAALHRHIDLAHARLARTQFRHGWLRFAVKDLETNPHTQYKVHFYGAIYWLLNFPAVTLLFFFEPTLWLKLGIFITLIYSIYANFATDYGGMSAAMASFGTSLPDIPGEPVPGAGSELP